MSTRLMALEARLEWIARERARLYRTYLRKVIPSD